MGLSLLYLFVAAGLDGYFQYQLTQAMLNGVVIIGLVLLTGISGQVSLGHGAFVAIGAFATAALMNVGGWNAYAAVLAAGCIGFSCGFAFGWPALRLGFVYLTLATFGLAVVTPQILKSDHLAPWTGGVQGQYLDRPLPPSWFPGSEDYWWFLIVTALLVAVIIATRNIISSRNGRALLAVRDQPLAAMSSGINVKLYKTMTFGISAMFAAVAGGLSALLADFVSPDGYPVFLSFMFLVGLVFGGSLSIWGAIFGGFFIYYVPVLAGEAYKTMSFPIFGLILLIAILAMPDGLAGRFNMLRVKWRDRRTNEDTIS
jgi:branched-chain amino acid transport system permease protein